jgi:squalene-associated FAD-dependent desaturase
MAPQAGGRARSVPVAGQVLDNGQHILVGAYAATLELMRLVGADPDALLLRLPLVLRTPEGQGLALPAGAPGPAFVRAVLGAAGWSWPDRLRLLAAAAGWGARRFRCDDALTVADLCRGLPAGVMRDLIEPLCVAALNTPAREAGAAVFLRVLRDALFGGRGSSDLLLPRAGLDALLPQPARRWLEAHGVPVRLGRRVQRLEPAGGGWRIDGEHFDAAVLACTATEAARLARPVAPGWAALAGALRYEPIVTVYLRDAWPASPLPMLALRSGAGAPAQFAFDLGRLGGRAGVSAWVVSGAAEPLAEGLETLAQATCRQAAALRAASAAGPPPTPIHAAAERRATFRCTPALQRPPAAIAPGLWAAGDYVAGPYPATLEGAVRAGRAAAQALRQR